MHIKYISLPSANSPTLLRKVAVVVSTAALAGVVLMFSAVFLVVILAGGAFAAAYLWWKTRHLRKMMRNFPPSGADMESGAFAGEGFKGEVIEGEVVRVHEPQESTRR